MVKKDQKIYKSNIAFYRIIMYLKGCGMVTTRKVEQCNEYFLTDKGKLFGLWLSQLPDNKFVVENFEKQFGKPELVKILDNWFSE